MSNPTIQPTKVLAVKKSNFVTPLTFNEWVEKYKVSSQYVEPTKYFQGNPSCGITQPKKKSLFEAIREEIVFYFS